MSCHFCGGFSIEYDAGQGNSFCTTCGTVLEENSIISEISFNEGAGGGASVVGIFVGEGKSGARTMGPGRRQTSQESREKTLEAARRRIMSMAVALKLNENHADKAHRYFNLAITNNFIQGRRSQHVVACCLYIVCRMEKTNHMLIDFSELLQLNVFKLGVTYLHLTRQLKLQMPLIEPAIFIARFAAMLDFGEDTQRVAADATRLVARMDRDWIHTGRRPAGICGACLLIAARMHHYRRSQKEIIQVVKIGESTLRKRLDEFAATPSGQLTVSDFRELWLEDSADPPSFKKNRKRQHWELGKEGEEDEDEANQEIIRRGGRTSRIQLTGVRESGDEEEDEESTQVERSTSEKTSQKPNEDPGPDHKDTNGVENGDDSMEADKMNGDQSIEAISQQEAMHESEAGVDVDINAEGEGKTDENGESEQVEEEGDEEKDDLEMEADDLDEEAMEQEMEDAMHDPLILEEEARLDAEDEARRLIPYEELDDVDDDEIESVILNDEEVRLKTQVWMEFNKDFLIEQEQKRLRMEAEKKQGIYHNKKGRKKMKRQPMAPVNSAAEAGRAIVQPRLPRLKSKKINYTALDSMEDLFDIKPSQHKLEGTPGPISVFEENNSTPKGSLSRHSSVPPREGSNRPGRLSSVSRMIKGSGATPRPRFSTPGSSRPISREQSVVARSATGDSSALMEDDDMDEPINPPPSRTRLEREADELAEKAMAAAPKVLVTEEVVEEEDQVNNIYSMMGYSQPEEEAYHGDGYDEYNDYDD